LLKRPYVLIDARKIVEPVAAAAEILKFVEEKQVRTLNVAGPRLSGWAEGYGFALAVVGEMIERTRKETKSA
jgi:hypothetical protein